MSLFPGVQIYYGNHTVKNVNRERVGNPVLGDGIHKGSVWLEVFGFGDYFASNVGYCSGGAVGFSIKGLGLKA